MDFVPLHNVPKYFQECAEILNEEWKRSLAARLHSLEKSCDNFPVSLVLLLKDKNGTSSVIGHSKLSQVLGRSTKACLVESVVVRKCDRGKGYGRTIMEKTEAFAVSKGYKTMYLTTHDKQDFYRHLGYEFCSPIVSFDSSIVPEHIAQKLLGNMSISNAADLKNSVPGGVAVDTIHKTDSSDNTSASNETDDQKYLEDSASTNENNMIDKDRNVSLSQPLAPPPPPAPAPPPPPCLSTPMSSERQVTKETKGETVTRWDPKLVSWMKKTLSVKGYKTMYLTTHDKQDFYRHLGYEFCSPIVSFDSSIVPEHIAQKLLGNMSISNAADLKNSVPGGVAVDTIHKTDSSDNTSASNETDDQKYLEDSASTNENNMIDKDRNVSLSQPLAPPPPPAPAPPPPPCLSTPVSSERQVTKETKGETVTRWDPKLVSWMKKTLSV